MPTMKISMKRTCFFSSYNIASASAFYP